jgi:prepilin-type N-terminal cleavage/methylation domain-containing protein
MTLKTTYNNQKGFTLIEMIIVITVISIIAGIASIIILEGLKSYQTEVSFSDIHNQGRLAIERMAREIRMIRSATATDISTMTATNLQFNDVNGNTNVLFQRSGASAPYSIVRNGQVLANNVQSVSFSYYQQDGVTVAAAATQVWFIQIDLTTVNRGETLSMRVRVHPRNF